ncbi:hypothetical protein VMCG_07695 [Cytospora schulzeri]|uniref:FAD dependent oxidoreductase domain-containing protein n=1 Tax=Cytospora schulzeri TaxID=448051 RepID=A0A423VZ07_9PEZI|nr:hypothetical protein VMCG_07695 [Valsa malicola]
MVIREVVEGQSGLPVPNSTLSYWHTDPSKKLTGHRTTPDLPTHADTVIIGTGMTGAFAARFLKEYSSSSSSSSSSPSSSLVVLEAREACWGATGRNGGHCQPFLYGTSEEIARFELETYFFLRDLIAREDVKCDWRGVPGVHAILSQEVFDAGARAVPALRRRVPDFADKIAMVSPEGLVDGPDGEYDGEEGAWARGLTLEKLRLNRPEVKGAFVQKYAASMWPYKLVCHVLERLVAEHEGDPGAFNLQTNTPVTNLTRDTSSSSSSSSGRWEVTTPRGRISAGRVLLATNAYTSRLLPAFSDLIVPVRGQIGALVPPEPRVGLDYSYVFFGKLKDEDGRDTTRDEYLVQRPVSTGGELILGGGRHAARRMAVGEWRDDVVEPEVARWLRTEIEPVLSLDGGEEGGEEKGEKDKVQEKEGGLKASMEWTGIMAYSRDHVPWIGEVPEALGGGEGLYIASGFTGHGMPRCALAGRGIARIMMGDKEGHGLPGAFLASEERAKRAREEWGPVGSVDEMEALVASL